MSDALIVRGARTHNLKNITVSVPKNKLTVVTGVSGSGKSSLAFDTIYAEGQRKYLESLSTYARMIVSSMSEDTEVDEIIGLSPTISIHQKTISPNPRSTVGTITEIYDFLRLLYATIGIQSCPRHPHISLRKDTITDIVAHIRALPVDTKFFILAPYARRADDIRIGAIRRHIVELGYLRYMIGDTLMTVSEDIRDAEEISAEMTISIVIDRLIAKTPTEENEQTARYRDSVETAYRIGDSFLVLFFPDTCERRVFTGRSACPECDYRVQDLSLSHFSFNSHHGACPECHGLGLMVAFLEKNIVNPRLSLNEGALLPWMANGYHLAVLKELCTKYHIPMDIPYVELPKKARGMILHGVPDEFEVAMRNAETGGKTKGVHIAHYEGLIPNLTRRYHGTDERDSGFVKRITQYATEVSCEACHGYRIRPESLCVRIAGRHIGEIADLSVTDALAFFRGLMFTETERTISRDILRNVLERLEFLSGVGLGYMTISRRTSTISGGEAQRIRLATQIGTRLEGIIYVLDEPSIGLHPVDNDKLIANIRRLADIGNTVIVVEHDEDMMRHADHIIDIGPGAGIHGGHVSFTGTYDEILESSCETGKYLSGRMQVSLPVNKRKPYGYISIVGASENNLKNINRPLSKIITST